VYGAGVSLIVAVSAPDAASPLMGKAPYLVANTGAGVGAGGATPALGTTGVGETAPPAAGLPVALTFFQYGCNHLLYYI
jgi:hypothetical protein